MKKKIFLCLKEYQKMLLFYFQVKNIIKKIKNSEIIGYRYYNKDNNYFTLVKKDNEDEYIIFRKNTDFEF